MTDSEITRRIDAGEAPPVVLLEGDDPQAKQELAERFAALVDEGLQAFNVETLHAGAVTSAGARDQMIAGLLATARTLPMMAARRVVIVHDADRLLSPRKARDDEEAAPAAGKRKRGAAPTAAEALEDYIANPEPMTTVVFAADGLDGNRRLVKLLRKHAAVVKLGELPDAAAAARWVRGRLEGDGLDIEPAALRALLAETGLSLPRIRAEVEKLVLYAAGQRAITVADVRTMVAGQNDPGEGFALGQAIWNGNVREALNEVAAQLDAGLQPPMILGQVRAAVGRLRPDDRVRGALAAVFETDLLLKSSGGEPRYLLERLVISVCGRR